MCSNVATRRAHRIVLPDELRDRLADLATDHGHSFATLSRVLGRGEGYVGRFIRDKVPFDLSDADRLTLAQFFGVSPATLGARDHRPANRSHAGSNIGTRLRASRSNARAAHGNAR
jgi:hypothetical protein